MAYRTIPRFEGDFEAFTDEELVRAVAARHDGLDRGIASEVLHRVADAGESGNTVKAFDAITVRRAVTRIASNYAGWEE